MVNALSCHYLRLLYEEIRNQLWHYPLTPNTNYFELIFPCTNTIIKPSSETQNTKAQKQGSTEANQRKEKEKQKSKTGK